MKNSFTPPPKMKVKPVANASPSENNNIYNTTPPPNDTVSSLKKEVQQRHQSLYSNPSEKIPKTPAESPTSNNFTKIKNLLRVKYGGGQKY